MEMANIEGDEIVIRVPIAALADACQVAWDEEYGFEEHNIRVVDPPVFAKEFVRALNNEEEDGTTPIHKALDEAAVYCAEQGAEGLNDDDQGSHGFAHPDEDRS